ncbi:hypothetical protein BC939DRAFT_39577 [Gamsiella multidivaricata]|uniref:uncharacterized protein n=1 Tax=Gamsiella multidivaricata TaxID=101098 RepID=UPI002220F706|nr:uncharacterized protein BC939DRAFT_39577 [Gamsiella multidivaricata]KAI7828981.1 hypothetical protein BC939DRAFT_39577 [Gamsiella multidivaricata]
MAVKWPHPPLAIPPVSPDSNPDLDPGPGPEPTAPPPPRIPPRPYSAEFNISTDRFIALSSPMLQSTGSARQSAAPVSERRESAPSPSHSSFFSPLSSPVAGINKTEQPRQRPRSNSHIQLPLYSPASQHRPLPALPVTKRAVTPTEDGIKVPVDDDRSYNSVPSPRNLNANRLHPNNFPHPHSPQFIPKDLTRNSYQHRNSIDSVPGSAMASVHPLEYQSSMSSSGSSTSNSRYLAYLRQPMNLRGESNTFIPAQTQELLHRYDDGPGHSPGQLSREGGQQLQYEQANASASGSRVSNERSLHHYPLNHMQDGAVQSSKQRPTGPSTSSFTGSQQSSVRLPNRNMSLSSSLSSTTEYNSAASLSSFSSPSLFHQEYPGHSQSNNSADLLSYYPPPPLSNITTVQPHYFGSSTESQSVSVATESPTPSSAKLPTNSMPANKSSTLPPNHNNRRHSSGLHKLSIKTHHLYTVKKGPSTADVAGPGNRHLEPENTIKGTAQSRPRLKQPAPSSSSYLLPRQSPNHLVIPQAPQPPSAYSTQQHSYSNAQHPLDTRQQHQAQVQHQPSHSQGRQRMPSTVRSPSSPGMTSPSSGPWLFETMQDRTAMSLMQQYLIQPDDPDSEVDIAMQIMISQAAVDSKGFEVLIPQTVESIKRAS